MDHNHSDSLMPDVFDPWHDDVLDRRGFAEFLTSVLTEQARVLSERQQRGLTVALDAEWGAGKTFFIERWADSLRRQGYPVVMFDAWKHDLGEAPAIVLMAAIDEGLREWLGRTSIHAETKERALALGRKGIRQLRRAVMPAGGVILSGLLKKYTGIAVKDLKSVYNAAGDDDDDVDDSTNDAPSSDVQAKEADSDEQAKIDAGLDRIFEKMLSEQTQRIEAIAGFREEMGRVISLIREDGAARMPVFVFVDELDRCRPSYAISLLEEIKHIFGMPQVCFVVSTNITQLSHSVRAIYGHEFDAEHYLKRFYDQTYTIPNPGNRSYISLLLKESPLSNRKKIDCGLPPPTWAAPTIDQPISMLFEAFALDLRSQRQVFGVAETAAIGIESEKPLYVFWLFFLAILIHKDQALFSKLMTKEKSGQKIRPAVLPMLTRDALIPSTKGGFHLITDVLQHYYDWSYMDASELNQTHRSDLVFPDTNIMSIISELPYSYNPKYPPSVSISRYADLVKYAGYRRESSE